MDSVTEALEKLGEIGLFYLDFSAVANIRSEETLNEIRQIVLTSNSKLVVQKNFYEYYGIVIKTTLDEQRRIAVMAYTLLNDVKKRNNLLLMSEGFSSEELISKLRRNDKVCFIYYKYSECAELVRKYSDSFNASGIVIDENGDYTVCGNSRELMDITRADIDPASADDGFLRANFNADTGKKVKLRTGEEISLGRMLGNGGEGKVYACDYTADGNTYVVKIYHEGQLNKLRLKKLAKMENRQIRYNGLIWPEKEVFSLEGRPVGYLMKEAEGKPLSTIFDSDESICEYFPNWTRKDLVNLAIDILEKIQYLHLFGIIIGDLRLKNIIISKDGDISFVDMDSAQIDNLPCPTGFADFTPPELQRVAFRKLLRTFENESFSCAILVFKILFCGLHPYDQRNGADSIEEEISSRSFPYPQEYYGDFTRIPMGSYAEMWKHTPKQIQYLFDQFFKEGNRFELLEMIQALKSYRNYIDVRVRDFKEINSLTYWVPEEA